MADDLPNEWFRCLRREGPDKEDPKELEQGDLLPDVVVWRLDPEQPWQNEEIWKTAEAGNGPRGPVMQSYRATVIVVDQSCDLALTRQDVAANISKEPLDFVTVCPVVSKTEFLGELMGNDPDLILDQIRVGNNRRHFLLKERLAEPRPFEYSVVDLQESYKLPYRFLGDYAATIEDRLRLKSPMRESLGAAFGGCFSRVAIDPGFEIKSFIKADKKRDPEVQAREAARRFVQSGAASEKIISFIADLAQNPAYQDKLKQDKKEQYEKEKLRREKQTEVLKEQAMRIVPEGG